jgi:hypothetical protein
VFINCPFLNFTLSLIEIEAVINGKVQGLEIVPKRETSTEKLTRVEWHLTFENKEICILVLLVLDIIGD